MLTTPESQVVTHKTWCFQGCTALHTATFAQAIAARFGMSVKSDAEASPETLKVLIQNGADVNATSHSVRVCSVQAPALSDLL